MGHVVGVFGVCLPWGSSLNALFRALSATLGVRTWWRPGCHLAEHAGSSLSLLKFPQCCSPALFTLGVSFFFQIWWPLADRSAQKKEKKAPKGIRVAEPRKIFGLFPAKVTTASTPGGITVEFVVQ